MTAARESGWYRVQMDDAAPEIAHWDAAGECWNGPGWHVTRGADYPLAVLSPRLTPPGSAAPPPDETFP